MYISVAGPYQTTGTSPCAVGPSTGELALAERTFGPAAAGELAALRDRRPRSPVGEAPRSDAGGPKGRPWPVDPAANPSAARHGLGTDKEKKPAGPASKTVETKYLALKGFILLEGDRKAMGGKRKAMGDKRKAVKRVTGIALGKAPLAPMETI